MGKWSKTTNTITLTFIELLPRWPRPATFSQLIYPLRFSTFTILNSHDIGYDEPRNRAILLDRIDFIYKNPSIASQIQVLNLESKNRWKNQIGANDFWNKLLPSLNNVTELKLIDFDDEDITKRYLASNVGQPRPDLGKYRKEWFTLFAQTFRTLKVLKIKGEHCLGLSAIFEALPILCGNLKLETREIDLWDND